MKSGIYLILNKITRQLYIGSAVNCYARFHIHKSMLNSSQHHNPYLQSAWNKYGESNFGFAILEECSRNKLIEREQFWIDYTKCCDKLFGYNSNPIAGNWLGRKHRPEVIEKIKQNHVGNRGKKMHENTKQALLIANRKPKSEDHKRKISEARKGKRYPRMKVKQECNLVI